MAQAIGDAIPDEALPPWAQRAPLHPGRLRGRRGGHVSPPQQTPRRIARDPPPRRLDLLPPLLPPDLLQGLLPARGVS